MFVYESVLHVPLILWRPGLLPSGLVVTEPVRATDLAPTLLELLGAPPLQTDQGTSLVPLLRGSRLARTPPIYAETYLPLFYMNWAPLRSLRDARFKLIDAPRPELYDLDRDPGERTNLYREDAPAAQALRRALARLTAGGEGAMEVGRLDAETAEKLASLGYLGAEHASPGEPGTAVRPEPKEMIAVFNRLRRANAAVRERRFDDAAPVLREVLRHDPNNAFATLVSGSAQMGLGHWRAAVAFFRRYLELVPTSAYAHHWIAVCQLRLGDHEAALREADATLAIDPRFSDARVLRAGVLASRGDYRPAIAELRQAVATDPAKDRLRLDLARVLAEAGHTAEARSEYERLLRAHPDDAATLTGLGALQAFGGELDAAERTFRRAIEVQPTLDEARIDLAQLLERRGRRAEALAEYRRLAESAATSPEIRARARKALSSNGSNRGGGPVPAAP